MRNTLVGGGQDGEIFMGGLEEGGRPDRKQKMEAFIVEGFQFSPPPPIRPRSLDTAKH